MYGDLLTRLLGSVSPLRWNYDQPRANVENFDLKSNGFSADLDSVSVFRALAVQPARIEFVGLIWGWCCCDPTASIQAE